MTRQEIRDMARKRLGETTARFWSDVELNVWLDEGGHDIAFKTKSLRSNSTLTTTSGTGEYSLSSIATGILSVLGVEYKQDAVNWVKLPATTRKILDRETPGWRNSNSSTPMSYYWDREENLFGVYPKPDSTNAGAYCKVWYSYDYSDLSDDTASPTLPNFLHMAIAHYIVALGYETRGHGDKANDAWGKYYARIQEYLVEKGREREDDVDHTVNYRNI